MITADAYLNQKVLGLGSSLAITHQLLLTFPAGEETIKRLVKPSDADELWLHGNTWQESSSGSIRKLRSCVTGSAGKLKHI